jgi:hypothetical protein
MPQNYTTFILLSLQLMFQQLQKLNRKKPPKSILKIVETLKHYHI